MNELESQIAKIQLGNKKTANSYVYIMAEKAPVGTTELYLVAELPLLNPAAEESCERICLAISSTFKRSYRRTEQDNSFENAIANINEELGKLTSLGQTQWVNKLNCILAVKTGNTFHIASCGKVSAFLLRNKEYTDISCSPAQIHPLKTFENYASGKIKLGDLLILSTTQLFNHLSMDRLLNIVSSSDFLTATKTIIEMLKAASDPQVAFGVLLNLQVPVGQTAEEDDDLESYIVEKPYNPENLPKKILAYIKSAFALDRSKGRVPKVEIPKISIGERMANITGNTRNILAKSHGWVLVAKHSAQNLSKNVNPTVFKNLSKTKKFFFISAAILGIAVIFSITVAINLNKTKTTSTQITNQLKEVQNLLLSAQGSVLYKDDTAATNYLRQAIQKLPDEKNVDSGNKELYTQILNDLKNTQGQMDKTYDPQVSSLGSIGQADNLISLPNYLGTQINEAIISYNRQNGKIEDSVLKLPIRILKSSYISGNLAAIYDGNNIYTWDFSSGNISIGFNEVVPRSTDWAGLAVYPTNNRAYLVDKKSASVISFLASRAGFSKPVVSVRNPELSEAIDIAIDSNIYILTKTGALKFQSGNIAEFSLDTLTTPFSGTGKIYTQKDFKYVYLLDSGNNRIIILSKKGELINSIKSAQFTLLKDFSVDEQNKTIYVLNDSTLLKVSLP